MPTSDKSQRLPRSPWEDDLNYPVRPLMELLPYHEPPERRFVVEPKDYLNVAEYSVPAQPRATRRVSLRQRLLRGRDPSPVQLRHGLVV